MNNLDSTSDDDDIPQEMRDLIDQYWEVNDPGAMERIADLFYQKLEALDPGHPWVKRWHEKKRGAGLRFTK